MPTVDTLKLKTRLSESGMPDSQAQVLVEELDEALSTAITRKAATKADVAELRAAIRGLEERVSEFKADNGKQLDDLKTDNASMKTETNAIQGELKLLRWMVGATLTVVVGIGIRLLFM